MLNQFDADGKIANVVYMDEECEVIRVEVPDMKAFDIGLTVQSYGGLNWAWIPLLSDSDGFEQRTKDFLDHAEREYEKD